MTGKASIEQFLWAIVVGSGFHIGWAIIGAVWDFVAKAM